MLPAAHAAGRSSRGCHRAVRTLPPAAPVLMRSGEGEICSAWAPEAHHWGLRRHHRRAVEVERICVSKRVEHKDRVPTCTPRSVVSRSDTQDCATCSPSYAAPRRGGVAAGDGGRGGCRRAAGNDTATAAAHAVERRRRQRGGEGEVGRWREHREVEEDKVEGDDK